MFYGSGAGKLPTASAVVADIIEEAKNLNKNVMYSLSEEKMDLMSVDNVEERYFVRHQGTEKDVEAVFGNVEQVVEGIVDGEIGFITWKMTYGEFQKKVEELGKVAQTIRVKD